MTFFGMGPFEILVILVIALMVFGPDRLPQVARQVGKMVRDFRRMTADLTAEFNAVTQEFSAEFDELKAVTQELQAELRGVQQELAGVQTELVNEIHGVGEALQPGGHATAPTYALTEPSAAFTNYTSHDGTTEGTATMNGNGASRPVASKEDPRADVSWFDLDELVVMPRTSRPSNGYHGLNGAAPTEAAPVAAVTTSRMPRAPRRAAIVYQRPRPQAN